MKSNRPPRPYWTGFLKLSLVTCGVRLYNATTESERLKFNEIHAPTGERVRRQSVVPGVGPVEREDIVKGFEYEKGRYVTVDPDDLKRLKLNSTDCIEITEVVDYIDPAYYDAPYYLLPEGGASEHAYGVICEALRASGKIAIGQVVVSAHERVVAIRATADGLLVNTLRYQDELRAPEGYYGTVAVAQADADEVAMMEQIIARKTTAFDPARYVDHYAVAVRDLIEQKLAGTLPAEVVNTPRAAPAGNLMDTLKASLAAEGGAAPAEKVAIKRPKAKEKEKPGKKGPGRR